MALGGAGSILRVRVALHDSNASYSAQVPLKYFFARVEALCVQVVHVTCRQVMLLTMLLLLTVCFKKRELMEPRGMVYLIHTLLAQERLGSKLTVKSC